MVHAAPRSPTWYADVSWMTGPDGSSTSRRRTSPFASCPWPAVSQPPASAHSSTDSPPRGWTSSPAGIATTASDATPSSSSRNPWIEPAVCITTRSGGTASSTSPLSVVIVLHPTGTAGRSGSAGSGVESGVASGPPQAVRKRSIPTALARTGSTLVGRGADLEQLPEHAAQGAGMDEGHRTVRPGPWLSVDELGFGRGEALQRRRQVIGHQADVVKALSPL